MYSVVFSDALHVNIRVRNKAVNLALGTLPDGMRDIQARYPSSALGL